MTTINDSFMHASVGIAASTLVETSTQRTRGLFYDALSNSVYRASINTMTAEYLIENNLERSGRSLIGALSRHLPRSTEKYEENHVKIFGVVLPRHQTARLWHIVRQ
jgi:hypothetical protein